MEPDPEDARGEVDALTEPDPARDPTRRTYLAQERTLLAWWRTALAVVAVGLGVGKLIPGVVKTPVGPFIALGVGYGVVGFAFVIYGTRRDRQVIEALRSGRYDQLGRRAVRIFAAALCLLVLGSIALIAWRP